MSDYTCLGKTVHATSYLAKHVTVRIYFVAKVVFFDDVLWEQLQFHAKVFVSLHWRHEVKILDVDGHEFRIVCGDDAVEHEFDGEEVRCWHATVVGVVD